MCVQWLSKQIFCVAEVYKNFNIAKKVFCYSHIVLFARYFI